MVSVQRAPIAGFVAQTLLLGCVALFAGLSWFGWIVGLGCATASALLLSRGMSRLALTTLGPADRVTLTRVVLTGGVVALVAQSFVADVPVPLLVALAAVALALDAVDGHVARRTGTASAFGARFDMEADAWLILVLSVYVSHELGWWVLMIGAARYVFVAASRVLPWLRRPLPYRYWRKVVAATQGVVLTVTASGVLPGPADQIVVLIALALLTESFGRDVVWLWRRRVAPVRIPGAPVAQVGAGHGPLWRTVAADLLAFLMLVGALVIPDNPDGVSALSLVTLPVELLAILGLALVLRARARRVVGAAVGLILALLTVLKLADMGFLTAFGRLSNPVTDWAYLGSAVDLLTVSIGRTRAVAVLVLCAMIILGLLIGLPWAVLRTMRLVAGHRQSSMRVVAALGATWVLLAAFGIRVASAPAASAVTSRVLGTHTVQTLEGVRDQRTFAEAAAVDPLRRIPQDRLLAGLRGKDVIVVFVESYGRVAVQDSDMASGVNAVLEDGTRRLAAAGFQTRSAWLTSPTFGGISWLAHSTLQSGLWINSQQRYDQLLATDRTTLSAAFKRSGWRTVSDVPSNEEDWSTGKRFYDYDMTYDANNVGYKGPRFGYATMPDQYVLDAFGRRELTGRDRPNVMAEIDLVSSHTPWTPLPRMVAWSEVGDGSVFRGMPDEGPAEDALWRNIHSVRMAYGKSVEYSLTAVSSFVEKFGDPNLVLLVLGDHQPATIVSGPGASHDVPVTIVAHDPDVLERIDGWGWQPGMRPGQSSPTIPMDAFRDRFIAAFSATDQPAQASSQERPAP